VGANVKDFSGHFQKCLTLKFSHLYTANLFIYMPQFFLFVCRNSTDHLYATHADFSAAVKHEYLFTNQLTG
ncbi:MAG: hypothetical protein LUC90_01665, partial [Lachnospiraceae bacterium]|nr:hypothetical protein [Lachnospiraceae bacterium]